MVINKKKKSIKFASAGIVLHITFIFIYYLSGKVGERPTATGY